MEKRILAIIVPIVITIIVETIVEIKVIQNIATPVEITQDQDSPILDMLVQELVHKK